MNTIGDTVGRFLASMPSSAAALLILLAGWIAAAALRFLVSRLLDLLRVDRLSERTGFAEFLRKGGTTRPASRLAGIVAYWIVLLVALFDAAKAMDPRIAAALSERAIGLLPNLFAALIIVVVGGILVAFLANFATTIARNAAMPHAALLSRSIKGVGYLIVATVALEQAGLGQTALSTMFLLLFGAAAFGLALAFGLGGKELARGAIERFLRNLRERERGSRGGDLEG